MLQKWLENRYPELLKRYFDALKPLPLTLHRPLDEWLSVLEKEVYSEYLEKIKPAQILGALLLDMKVSGDWFFENVEDFSLKDFVRLVEDEGLEVSFDDNIPLF